MFKTGPLSGNCVQVTYKLSANMHWWKLVAEEQMQLRVSGHFQLTLHAAPDRQLSCTCVNGPSMCRTTYRSQSLLQTRYWKHTYCCPDDLFPNGKGACIYKGGVLVR